MSAISRLPDRSQRDRGDECGCKACRDARPLIDALAALDLGDAGPADDELLNRPDPDFTYDEARRAGQEELF